QKFTLSKNAYPPSGDQPNAINSLARGVSERRGCQTLLGVTGSGKTFTVANVIARSNQNALVISHNKTLAAQLYTEFKEFFPHDNVGYFVSFYDYYQPESYIPQSDTYIEKETEINERIEKMRLEATAMIMSGEPTIIVATVSCIYSLGSPAEWDASALRLEVGTNMTRSKIIQQLINARYERNDVTPAQGAFRSRGDTIDIFPGYTKDMIRISLFDDEIERISIYDPLTLNRIKELDTIKVFPAKHYIIDDQSREVAVESIKRELEKWVPELPTELEKQRIRSRVGYDLEMIQELGYCSGIENYSRHFDGRLPGCPPYCLLDFFGEDFLLIIDESHVTIPQIHGMYNGDYTRKKNLVDYGFRLPSAFDNRPLKFEEFEKYLKNVIFVSATPGNYETAKSYQVIEQVVRPTGLVDPQIILKPATDQIDDLISEIKSRTVKKQRVLVTTLTKRMAEDLADYLSKNDIRVRYLHSEIQNLERTELIRQLRLGKFDVLVGINLLREGLDIPEVSMVAIMDADKEGFLRNFTSLIQTFGRAARNIDGTVILYANHVTKSMSSAVAESNRRRSKQIQHNLANKISPKSVIKPVAENGNGEVNFMASLKSMSRTDLIKLASDTEGHMKKFAEDLDFEMAIETREKLSKIRNILGQYSLPEVS
ncbi:MAG: excinuclease ABC subunit UvrB, partial [Nitrososphaeraceae archaeon]